jgi:hypothetical protein
MFNSSSAHKVAHLLEQQESQTGQMLQLVLKVYNDRLLEDLHVDLYPYLQNQSNFRQMLFFKLALP